MWEFEVRPESRPAFERTYGPAGEWADLFRRAEGYIGTLLLHDRSHPGRYLTIDRWQSEQAYRAFRSVFADEYEALDRKCEGWTAREASLGEYMG